MHMYTAMYFLCFTIHNINYAIPKNYCNLFVCEVLNYLTII